MLFFCTFLRTLISHSLAANFSLAMSTLCQFSWACFKFVLAKKIYFSKLNFRTQRWVLVFRLCSWLESATSQHLELLILHFLVLWWRQRHQQQWLNAGILFYFVFGFVLFVDEKLFCFSAYGIAYRGKDIIMALIVFPIKFIFMYSSSVYTKSITCHFLSFVPIHMGSYSLRRFVRWYKSLHLAQHWR